MIPYTNRLELLRKSVTEFLFHRLHHTPNSYDITDVVAYLDNCGEEQYCSMDKLYLHEEKVYVSHTGNLNQCVENTIIDELSVETLCLLADKVQFYGLNNLEKLSNAE